MSSDMLRHFPELLKVYEVFKMKPRVGGGYGERYDVRKVRAYWSQRKTGKTDVEGDLRVPDHKGTLWVQSRYMRVDANMTDTDFVEIKGVIYRVVQDDDFTLEGGFYKCLLQKLAGPTDQQVTNRRVDGAIAADY